MSQNVNRYAGTLTADDAAAAIQAARLNALDLADSAELLYTLKRFAHSVALGTLAIEEAGKVPLLFSIFLRMGDDHGKIWKSYRLHPAKTASLNIGVEARVRAIFPEIDSSEAREIGRAGPTPEELEVDKQRAVYSDCLNVDGKFVCHLPRNIDWREQAWERLCEVQALAHGLRDYTPEELEIWKRHADNARANGGDFSAILQTLREDLLKEGFIQEGWWDSILRDPAAEG